MQKRRQTRRRTAENMKVVTMDELKRSREGRASSVRPGVREETGSIRRLTSENTRKPQRPPKPATKARNGRHGLTMLLVMLALLAISAMLGWNIFKIHTIDVKGSESIGSAEIIKLSGIRSGDNIFKLSLNEAKKHIESDPLLEVKRIARVLPDKITIEIHQRKPHGAISYMGSYIIVDEECIVLDERDSLPAGQYPLITGIDIKPSVKGKQVAGIKAGDVEALDGLLTALYDNKAMPFIGQIDMKDNQNITMLSTEGLKIVIGRPEELAEKARWIAGTMPELRDKGYTKGVLYVTGANSPVYSASESGGGDAQTGDNAGDDAAGDQQGDSDEGVAPDDSGDQGNEGESVGNEDDQNGQDQGDGQDEDGQSSDDDGENQQDSGTGGSNA